MSEITDPNNNSTIIRRAVGRPCGTSDGDKKRKLDCELKVKNSICEKIDKEKKKSMKKKRRLRRGMLNEIIEAEKKKFGFTGTISENTIRN